METETTSHLTKHAKDFAENVRYDYGTIQYGIICRNI